ncbi:hypothetical protein [Algoriphagus halophytocola]|uniref:Uncharacterized protein n=1 Tax=Algoriphagus halophytocola TaxID=2991499 RepID=A0ABY6MD22_9BACT|nr:hypothetical protein [Algoriphagus sp. TR-M5]UZD21627.1 hypothetical protein OM944_13255 [Algoriphagus sp. TR-M5]
MNYPRIGFNEVLRFFTSSKGAKPFMTLYAVQGTYRKLVNKGALKG